MADRKTFSPDDWDQIGSFIKDELQRRKTARRDLEDMWAEVDRQVAMVPVSRDYGRGKKSDWYPELELPSQFNTLEVVAADARRLLFPRDTDWFDCTANLTDEYQQKFQERRAKFPMVGSQPAPMAMDQETADVLVKTVLDHYHRYYDFSANIDLWLAELIKYGTSAGRVREVKWAKFSHDFRGVSANNITGPAIIPSSIKVTYLDDTVAQVMQEGIMTGPLTLRNYWQGLEDLKRAAKEGGKDRGWMPSKIADLQPMQGPDDKKGQVELIFAEGDIIVPKSRESIFLPNVWVTIAVGKNGAVPVRFETNPQPFRSFFVGHYMRTEIDSPYGTSPLMKGQPVAEGMTEVFCDMLATSRLRSRPPVVWDRNDAQLQADGGPDLAPSAQIATDNPQGINALEIGDLGAAMNAYLAIKKSYEELTGVTDPRRSAEVKSHTTKAAADYQANIGLSRTEDFIAGLETGPITSILYMEYEIARKALGKGQSISVNQDGIQGWVTVAKDDMPEEVQFVVNGSSGLMDIQTRNQQAIQAHVQAVQGAGAAAQMGKPVELDFVAMIKDGYQRAGIQNADKYVKAAQPQQPQPPPPDPKMIEVQQSGQLAQAQMQADQQAKQAELAMKQQEMQAKQQIEMIRLSQDNQTKMRIAQLDLVKAIEVARIGAGADVQQNLQQIVADVLTTSHETESNAAMQMPQIDNGEQSKAIADAVMQLADHMKGMGEMQRQSLDAHAKTLEAMNKPRKRSVRMKKQADGAMLADIMEQ